MRDGGDYPRCTAYDPDTGQILVIFPGDPKSKELWPNHVEGEFDADDYFVVDGVAVLKPEEERGAMRKSIVRDQFIMLRNGKLADTDWVMGQDSPYTGQKLAEWKQYRQALRDLPDVIGDVEDLDSIPWPQQPA